MSPQEAAITHKIAEASNSRASRVNLTRSRTQSTNRTASRATSSQAEVRGMGAHSVRAPLLHGAITVEVHHA